MTDARPSGVRRRSSKLLEGRAQSLYLRSHRMTFSVTTEGIRRLQMGLSSSTAVPGPPARGATGASRATDGLNLSTRLNTSNDRRQILDLRTDSIYRASSREPDKY